MSPRKKALVIALLALHCLGLVHSAVSANLFYPQSPELASGFDFLRSFEKAVNRRDKNTWIDLTLRTYDRFLGVSQQWNTFAPIPPESNSSYEIIGVDDAGLETTLWSSGQDITSQGTGWLYDPRVKLKEAFAWRWPEFHQHFALAVAAGEPRPPRRIILRAHRFTLSADEQGRIQRSPIQTFDLMVLNR